MVSLLEPNTSSRIRKHPFPRPDHNLVAALGLGTGRRQSQALIQDILRLALSTAIQLSNHLEEQSSRHRNGQIHSSLKRSLRRLHDRYPQGREPVLIFDQLSVAMQLSWMMTVPLMRNRYLMNESLRQLQMSH